MALIIVLLCIGLQRFLGWYRFGHQLQHLDTYFHWMITKCSPVSKGHGLMGVLLVVLPALIVVSLVFTAASYLLGVWSYYLLATALLWLSIDARDLEKYPYADAKASDLFLTTYQRLFAIVFWFVIFTLAGFATGLLIYLIVVGLHTYLEQRELIMPEKKDSSATPSLLAYAKVVQSIMDWVPVRLLGLTYALAGHFSAVFKLWYRHLVKGITEDVQPLSEWGLAALGLSKQEAQKQPAEVIGLIDRSLIIWLVIVLLFTLGFWIG